MTDSCCNSSTVSPRTADASSRHSFAAAADAAAAALAVASHRLPLPPSTARPVTAIPKLSLASLPVAVAGGGSVQQCSRTGSGEHWLLPFCHRMSTEHALQLQKVHSCAIELHRCWCWSSVASMLFRVRNHSSSPIIFLCVLLTLPAQLCQARGVAAAHHTPSALCHL